MIIEFVVLKVLCRKVKIDLPIKIIFFVSLGFLCAKKKIVKHRETKKWQKVLVFVFFLYLCSQNH